MAAVAVVLLIVSASYVIPYYIQKNKVDSLASKFAVSEIKETAQVEEKVVVPVDFAALKQVNPDIYAWIKVDGVNINYPILRKENDNAYYLNHTYEKKKSVYGSIYTENYNLADFSDFNTVIYGHNMKNGTMFGSLKKFRNKDFFKQNRYIEIYMPDRILRYEIFSANVVSNEHILYSNDFLQDSVKKEYINKLLTASGAITAQGVEVTSDDNIITLSTCINDPSKRFIVSAVLIYDSDKE